MKTSKFLRISNIKSSEFSNYVKRHNDSHEQGHQQSRCILNHFQEINVVDTAVVVAVVAVAVALAMRHKKRLEIVFLSVF